MSFTINRLLGSLCSVALVFTLLTFLGFGNFERILLGESLSWEMSTPKLIISCLAIMGIVYGLLQITWWAIFERIPFPHGEKRLYIMDEWYTFFSFDILTGNHVKGFTWYVFFPTWLLMIVLTQSAYVHLGLTFNHLEIGTYVFLMLTTAAWQFMLLNPVIYFSRLSSKIKYPMLNLGGGLEGVNEVYVPNSVIANQVKDLKKSLKTNFWMRLATKDYPMIERFLEETHMPIPKGGYDMSKHCLTDLMLMYIAAMEQSTDEYFEYHGVAMHLGRVIGKILKASFRYSEVMDILGKQEHIAGDGDRKLAYHILESLNAKERV